MYLSDTILLLSLFVSFLEIDEDKDGRVSASELGTVLKSCGMHLNPYQLNALIAQFHSKEMKPNLKGNNFCLAQKVVTGTNQTSVVHPTSKRKSRGNSGTALGKGQHADEQVQWSVRDAAPTEKDRGLPYDEFVQLVFVDGLCVINNSNSNSSGGNRRIQYLQNLNNGNTVETLKQLPQRSLEGRRIIDRVKEKVRNKIIERRGSSLRQVFRSFDTDKDGQVSLHEMEEQIAMLLGSTVTPVEIGMLLLDLDKDGDGTINLREFSNLLGDQKLGGKGTSVASRVERNTREQGSGRGSGRGGSRGTSTLPAVDQHGREESLLTSSRSSSTHSRTHNGLQNGSSSSSHLRPSSAPFAGTAGNRNRLPRAASGSSPSRTDLKADRGAVRRGQSKEYCLPPKGNIREMTFPFKELYRTKKVPTKRQHTPICDTSELISTSRRRQHAVKETSVGFSFNHKDRARKASLHQTRMQRVRNNQARMEDQVVGPIRFEEKQKGDQRVQHLIRQRVDYYSKLQQRFERDRAMQLAAGV